MPRKDRKAPARAAVEDLGVLPLDLLLFHWGEPHVTDGGPCFCLPAEENGVLIHRRLPWEKPERSIDVLPRINSRDSQERPSTPGGGSHTP